MADGLPPAGVTVKSRVVVDFAPTCVASAIDQDDVVADTQIVTGCFRGTDKPALLQSLTLLDKDDVGEDLIIYFLNANVGMGAEDAAVDITDAEAENILGYVVIVAADYQDLINSQVVNIRNIDLPLIPVTNTSDLYIAIVGGVSNTGTYTAAGLTLRLGILQD